MIAITLVGVLWLAAILRHGASWDAKRELRAGEMIAGGVHKSPKLKKDPLLSFCSVTDT